MWTLENEDTYIIQTLRCMRSQIALCMLYKNNDLVNQDTLIICTLLDSPNVSIIASYTYTGHSSTKGRIHGLVTLIAIISQW